MFIVDVVFSETSVWFPGSADCADFVERLDIGHLPMTHEALWRAGQAFKRYRAQGGTKVNVQEQSPKMSSASERSAITGR